MRVMGLDISATATGATVISIDEPWQKPLVLDEKEINVKGLKGLDRALAIAEVVVEMVNRWKPDDIGVEGYGFGNAHTLAILVEVGTVVRLALKMMGRTWHEIPPNSIKRFVTGAGNAQKDKVLLELFKRFDLDAQTNNTGDAMGAAMVVFGAKGAIHLTKVQQDTIKKLSFCN